MSTRPEECGYCGLDHPSSQACPKPSKPKSALPKWTGEVSVMKSSRSYYCHPVFVTVDASTWEAAAGAAAREGRRRLLDREDVKGRVIESVLIKITRVKTKEAE